MNKLNMFRLTVPALSRNEAFCRSTAIAFAAQADPTIEEIADIKTIMSEAVTNCIVHAYKDEPLLKNRVIYITGVQLEDNTFKFTVKDKGCGISDIKQAMQPLFTTDAENERSGMGLPIMQAFSDKLKITSSPGKGTTVTFVKRIGGRNEK
ncbi:MAG: anti-sigma F factor [Ruminococcaceae bacterium]|nr:anti-sigma F factor [Oscillospiraceae bacterium]